MATAAEMDIILRMKDEATTQLQHATKAFGETEKAGKSMGSTLGGIAKQAAGFAAGMGVIGGVSKAFDLVKGSVIGFNSQMQQATIGFTTMLGSGEKANAFLKDLQTFAAKTPFEFPELVESSQRMLAMGISAEKVVPTLTAVGDAVAALGGNGETVNRVTLALGQMQAKGKVSAEEMMQLTEAGIPAWDLLAKKIGVSVPEAMKMAEKGAIESGVALDAITSGMEDRFGGMMAKQSQTFGGAMSTIKDSLNIAVGTAFKPFFDMIATGSVQLASFLSGDTFAAWSASASAALGQVAGILGEMIPRVVEVAKSIGSDLAQAFDMVMRVAGPALSFVRDNFDSIAPVVLAVVAAFAGLSAVVSVISGVAGAVGTLTAAITAAGGVIPAVVAVLGGPLTLAIGAVALAIAGLVIAWQNDWGNIREITAAVADFIGARLGEIVDFVKEHWPQIKDVALDVWDGVRGIVETAVTAVQKVAGDAIAEVRRFWDENGQEISAAAQRVWDGIRLIVTAAVQAVQTIITTTVAIIRALWDQFGSDLTAIARLAWDNVAAVVKAGVQIIESTIRLVTALINGDWSAAWDAAKEIVATAFGLIKTLVQNAITEIGIILRGIAGAIGDLSGVLVSAGADLIRGMISGVRSMAGQLAQSALDVVGDAVDAVKHKLGIRSPSEVTFEEIGVPMGQGIAAGILSQADIVTAAAVGVAQQAVAAAAKVTAGPSVSSTSPYGITVTTQQNYQGIAGLVSSQVQDSFGTTFNLSVPQGILDQYGGNLEAFLRDLESRGIRARAMGGPAGGWTWTGERGPELVKLPGGSHVYSHQDSMAMTSGGGYGPDALASAVRRGIETARTGIDRSVNVYPTPPSVVDLDRARRRRDVSARVAQGRRR